MMNLGYAIIWMGKPMKTNDPFIRSLRRLFSQTCLVRVTQTQGWKKGKTDFGLLVSEILLKENLVDKVASNIYTFETFPCINNLEDLNYWLRDGKDTKLYVFDELNDVAPNRRFMSAKNFGVAQIFPQLSKKHGRMIAIAQDFNTTDNVLSNPSYLRGTFIKLALTTVELQADFYPDLPHVFKNIPRTSIKFDPFLEAEFNEKSISKLYGFKDEDFNKLQQLVQLGKEQKSRTAYKTLGFSDSKTYHRWWLQTIEKMLDVLKSKKEMIVNV